MDRHAIDVMEAQHIIQVTIMKYIKKMRTSMWKNMDPGQFLNSSMFGACAIRPFHQTGK